jgi:hypothetical protein
VISVGELRRGKQGALLLRFLQFFARSSSHSGVDCIKLCEALDTKRISPAQTLTHKKSWGVGGKVEPFVNEKSEEDLARS